MISLHLLVSYNERSLRSRVLEKRKTKKTLGTRQRGLKDTFSRSKPAWRGPNVVGIAQAFGQRTGKVKFPEKSYGNGVDKFA